MGAILRLRDKEYEVDAGMTVRDAMLRNGILPDSVIPTRDGELITDDEIIREGERIRLVAVISGGSSAGHDAPAQLAPRGSQVRKPVASRPAR